ncbi:hypothetical protein SAMN05192574_104202 [Mucilaginibacter gossypiicola]|uniref:Uncharacterized protein n=1 Tax=Mucilaginibacter gossypiicola TaxID=551995 RepID=A0A1H8JIT4_9SPHI|nr:hypothetical protein [Mucilaginibacter gossypiicola]SEN80481.1 hypothetical protein SAMN05192574_104202 [Mucilaginibacter gossypiicola]
MIKKIFFTSLIWVIATVSCFAQIDFNCDSADDDAFCPLDTWVIVLAVAAFAFAAFHLYRKQKSLQA